MAHLQAPQEAREGVEVDLMRRTQSFVRRDREYKTKIELLEAELSKVKSASTPSLADAEAEKHMSKLRDLHGSIVVNIEHVQEQTARILQEQERDLLRAFRARLFDLQTELEKEKSRAEDGAAVWIEKNRQLQKELDWAKEMADRLDRHNQALTRENARLKNQFKTQEDDREYLIKQLVAAKKDNARLRQEMNKAREETASLQAEITDVRIRTAFSAEVQQQAGDGVPVLPNSGTLGTSAEEAADGVVDASAGAGAAGMSSADENRYRDVILRLKKLLDAERKAARQVRSQLTAELGARSEAEMFLRRSIEDAKVEIDRKRQAVLFASLSPMPRLGGSPRASSARHLGTELEGLVDMYTSLSKEDREQILASLLAQEHVLTALQRITFPTRLDSPHETPPSEMEPVLGRDREARLNSKPPGFSKDETSTAVKTWSTEANQQMIHAVDSKLAGLDDKIAIRARAGPASPRSLAASRSTGNKSPERYKTSTLGKAALNVVAGTPKLDVPGSVRPGSRGARPPSSKAASSPEGFRSDSHALIENILSIQAKPAPSNPLPSSKGGIFK